jgi:hypothetical protein
MRLFASELILILSFLIVMSLTILDGDYAPFLATYMVIFCFYIIFNTNKSIISIYSVFISTYFIYILPYFYFSISFASRDIYQDEDISLLTLQLISYFVFFFLLLVHKRGSESINFAKRIYRVNNPFAYWACLVGILVFAFLMTSSKGTILNSTYSELTEERYSFIGYSVVFIVIAFVTHKTSAKRMLLLAVISLYCLVCLLYGYRLRFLNAGLLTFILFFENKWSKKYVTYIAFFAFFFISFIGQFRSGEASISFLSMLGILDGRMVSNQGGVYLTSNIYIGATIDGLISLQQRVGFFINFLFSSIVPNSLYPDSYNLKSFAKQSFDIPGGGFITAYLYVFGGYIAVGVAPFIIAKIYRLLYSTQFIQGHMFVYLITASAMFINWFAYTPTSLFKMAVYSLIGYLLVINFGVVKDGKLSVRYRKSYSSNGI